MGQFYDEIPEFLITWIQKQHLFWVASAPAGSSGHVNVSPKGLEGVLHVVNSKRVWYEDLTGSGVETISHIRENGRITILFSAFEGPPRICRLFGTGTVHEFGTPEYDDFLPEGKRHPGSRSVIVIDVHKVGTACGYGVPFYEFQGHRTQHVYTSNRKEIFDNEAEVKLIPCEKAGDSEISGSQDQIDASTLPALGLRRYWLLANSRSIDGIPGLQYAPTIAKKFVSLPVPPKKKLLQDSSAATDSSALQIAVNKVKSAVDARILLGFALGVVASGVYHQFTRRLVEIGYHYAL
ncbi:hypothetical protein AX16_007130 [Volvariella volvacea WC 439]|nr:hypothetical protein AX16_007130 [Volvariella volvacea WC 439]